MLFFCGYGPNIISIVETNVMSRNIILQSESKNIKNLIFGEFLNSKI